MEFVLYIGGSVCQEMFGQAYLFVIILGLVLLLTKECENTLLGPKMTFWYSTLMMTHKSSWTMSKVEVSTIHPKKEKKIIQKIKRRMKRKEEGQKVSTSTFIFLTKECWKKIMLKKWVANNFAQWSVLRCPVKYIDRVPYFH